MSTLAWFAVIATYVHIGLGVAYLNLLAEKRGAELHNVSSMLATLLVLVIMWALAFSIARITGG